MYSDTTGRANCCGGPWSRLSRLLPLDGTRPSQVSPRNCWRWRGTSGNTKVCYRTLTASFSSRHAYTPAMGDGVDMEGVTNLARDHRLKRSLHLLKALRTLY